MKFAEIEQEAPALPERERAAWAAKLLDTLPPAGTDISDEERRKAGTGVGVGTDNRHFA